MFSVDFFDKSVSLMKEAFKFKKYKCLSMVFAIIIGILMIPFVISSFVLFAFLVAFSYLYKVISTPTDFIHKLVTEEAKDVHGAAQFVIYFVSWGYVLISYILLTAVSVFLVLMYTAFAINTYIWSLGGFKLYVMANEAYDIEKEVEGQYSTTLAGTYVAVSVLISFVIPVIHAIALYADLWMDRMEDYFVYEFSGVVGIYVFIGLTFSALYSLIGFAPRPKKVCVEEAPEVQE